MLDSPVLLVFLRALAFVGLTEAIFFRLLPPPGSLPLPEILEPVYEWLHEAGRLTFIVGFFFAMTALINVAYRTLRHRPWSPVTNALVASCLLCMAVLGFSAAAMERGPIFAICFSLLALLTLLLMGMQAYAGARFTGGAGFALCWGAAMICATSGSLARILAETELASPPPLLLTGSIQAGWILVCASAAMAFITWFGMEPAGGSRLPAIGSFLLGGTIALAVASLSLPGPGHLSLLGPQIAAPMLLLVCVSLFLGVATASSCLLDPKRRTLGYGLLLLILAGYPPRIAYENMLMVLGSALVLAPRRTQTRVIAREPIAPPEPERPGVPAAPHAAEQPRA